MNNPLLKKAVEIAENGGCIIIATSDSKGIPHIATAGKLQCDANKDMVKVTEWFCSKTVANLRTNEHISVAVWQPQVDKGYQLRGVLTGIENTAVLDGYMPQEAQEQVPQSRKELLIQVEAVTEFRHAVHSDENLLEAQDKVEI
jgi:hypothetical protein